ncbi:MAG: diguanylate cyclase [Chlorobiaceae bacterium]|nr:diguanylate cyclase [Chlorobiaceae bacterium]
MMNTTMIRYGYKIAFALAFLIILGADIYLAINLRALIASNQRLHQAHTVQGKLDETLALIVDAETGPRGYVIMGQEKFLEPYYAAVSSAHGIDQHLQELRRLTSDNPRQQRQLDLLDPLVRDKLAFMKKVVELRRGSGFDEAQKLIATDVGRQAMVEVRKVLFDMQNTESLLVQQQSDQAVVNMQKMIFSITTSAGLGLLLLSFAFVMLEREVRSRRAAEEGMRLLNSELDRKVQQRTSELSRTADSLFAELEVRKANELKIAHLSRMYATLGQVNQTILRVKDKDKMFQTICRIAVEYGGFGLAWIGQYDPGTGLVKPNVVYGKGRNLLSFEAINIRQAPFSKGIIASAVETGNVVSTQNIQTDPAMQQWWDMVSAGGYHSAAAVPIRLSGVIVALLSIYAGEVDFFTGEEVKLLDEMGRDVSFALDTLHLEAIHRKADELLVQSQRRFKDMFEDHSAVMLIIDPVSGSIIEANNAAAKFYGWSIEELRRMQIQDINVSAHGEITRAIEQGRTGERNYVLNRHCRSDGSVRDVEVYSSTIESDGKVSLYTIIHDVTERKHYEIASTLHIALLEMESTHSKEELLQMTLDEAEQLTESSIGFFYFVSADETTLTLQARSTNTQKMVCTPAKECRQFPLNTSGVLLESARQRKAVIRNDFGSLKDRKEGIPDIFAEIRRELIVPVMRDDRIVAIVGVCNKNTDYNAGDAKWVGILGDIVWDIIAKITSEDEQKILQTQHNFIENMALHDYLTGLPNRRLLSDRISQTIAQCQRSKTMAALMLFDLDRFKPVNDTLGHAIGDLLLQALSTRVLATLRRSGDTLARLGGDEFVVLLPQIAETANAVSTAEKILQVINEPFDIEGHAISISCSIGIAVYPLHGKDELALIRHADHAMYKSKSMGRNCITVFADEPSELPGG